MVIDRETSERWQIDDILVDLALPPSQWVVVGSAVMILHGIRRKQSLGDLDIFCSTRLWFDLLFDGLGEEPNPALSGGWEIYTTSPKDPARRVDPPYLYKDIRGLEVNLFYAWRFRDFGNINVNTCIDSAELVGGWPCMKLGRLLSWKQACDRNKDQDDIAAIKDHLLAKKGLPAVK